MPFVTRLVIGWQLLASLGQHFQLWFQSFFWLFNKDQLRVRSAVFHTVFCIRDTGLNGDRRVVCIGREGREVFPPCRAACPKLKTLYRKYYYVS